MTAARPVEEDHGDQLFRPYGRSLPGGVTGGTLSNSESPYWRKSRYDPYTKNY